MSESDTVQERSDFNEAGLQIQRLHGLWLECHQFKNLGDFYNWNYRLDSIWLELSADAQSIDKKFYPSVYGKINYMIKKIEGRGALFQMLMRKHEFLRGLQERAGKGSKRSTQDDMI